MKISLLLELEPFYTIFRETLGAYFQNQDGQARIWNADIAPCSAKTTLYVNERLNCIFQAHTSFVAFKQVRKEFRTRTRGHAIYKILQLIYVYLATIPFLSTLFANCKLCCSPPIPLNSTSIILGGRSILRILDPVSGTVSNLLKQGADSERITNRILLRSSRPFPFIPPIISTWDTGFSEHYLDATPINRLWLQKNKNFARKKALSILTTFSETLVSTCSAQVYIQRLVSGLDSPHFSEIASKWASLLLSLPHPDTVTLCFSHGDFQDANLLFSKKGELWVIDWENVGNRSIFYDAYTYFLHLRQSIGLAMRLERFLRSHPGAAQELSFLNVESTHLPFSIGLAVLEHLFTVYTESKWFPEADPYPELYDFSHELYQIKKVLTSP